MGGRWESRKCAETMKWREGGGNRVKEEEEGKEKKHQPLMYVRMYVCWSG